MIFLADHPLQFSVGYSFRKLRRAYLGNCCKIRRSSDSTEQDFGFVDDIVDTSGIASFIGGGSGFGTIWYDQFPQAIDLLQATAANQPQFIASSNVGSKPAWRFDGTNDFMQAASGHAQTDISHVNEATLMVVFNITDGQDQSLFALDNNAFGGNDHQFYLNPSAGAGNTISWIMGDADQPFPVVAFPANFTGNAKVMIAYKTPDGIMGVEVANTQVGSTSTSRTGIASGTAPFPLMIGQSQGFGQNMLGDHAELVAVKTGLAARFRTVLHDNAAAFYGT